MNSFDITLFIKETKLLENGETAFSMRVTIDHTDEKKQNPLNREQASPSSCNLNETNLSIDDVKKYFLNILQENKLCGKPLPVSSESESLPINNEPKKLLKVFHQHNEDIRKLIGIDYARVTVLRYDSCARYLEEHIRKKYKKDDLLLDDLNGEFVRGFELFMKTVKGCSQSTTNRYLKCLKKVINMSIANEWISKNPFAGIRFHEREVFKEFITKDELNTIICKKFNTERLSIVRDVFVFCCFTGLSFVDVMQLRPEHIIKDSNGNSWIRKSRQKTKNMCNIPLLDISQAILQRYKRNSNCIKKGVCLPVFSNQKMNMYLKEIAMICGIKKRFTTHVARHTCASVVLLANDVSLSNVAKILGHSDTRMTQHYARVLDSSIMRDMSKVKEAFLV
jgi:Site-specific recombinase XerD